MNEDEWLASGKPEPMLAFLRGKVSHRKLHLFGCACCRCIWQHLTEGTEQRWVELGELLADGQVTFATAEVARQQIDWRLPGAAKYAVWSNAQGAAEAIVYNTQRVLVNEATSRAVKQALDHEGETVHEALRAGQQAHERAWSEAWKIVSSLHAGLLRDIFGNPFRPVALDPAWRTDTVVALARGMYESRDFAAMPILADALQDAGCDNEDVLSHCRGAGPHVHGCWVVDLILGKK